jgi:hypothetical protein
MSRRAQTFRQGDLTKVAKAMANAGVKDWRAELTPGKIIVWTTSPTPNGDDGKPDPSEWD